MWIIKKIIFIFVMLTFIIWENIEKYLKNK